jgi:hypothetical protein
VNYKRATINNKYWTKGFESLKAFHVNLEKSMTCLLALFLSKVLWNYLVSGIKWQKILNSSNIIKSHKSELLKLNTLKIS